MTGRIALDLGTCRTRVADARGHLLLDEPTVAAVRAGDGSLVTFGSRALDAPGRLSGELVRVRPVVKGQLQDLLLTDQIATRLLRYLERRVGRHPDVLCSLPGLASGVQRRALERALKTAGANKVEMIDHAVAAAIGLRLQIGATSGTMTVDLGGGTTDAGVMALGGLVTQSSLPVGGEDLDRSISDLLLRSFDLVVSPRAAEDVKATIGTAWPEQEAKAEVTGRDVSNGRTRSVVVTSSEVHAAMAGHLESIVSAAVGAITNTPPDLANDLIASGLWLAGGGSGLAGISRRIATATGIPVHLAGEPRLAAVLGAARCLAEAEGVASVSEPKVAAGPRQPADR